MPKLETPEDAMMALAALAEGVANAEISPAEAGELGKLIDAFNRTTETVKFEKRLAALEGKSATLVHPP